MGKIPLVFPSYFRPLTALLFQALEAGKGPHFSIHLHGLKCSALITRGLAISWPLL